MGVLVNAGSRSSLFYLDALSHLVVDGCTAVAHHPVPNVAVRAHAVGHAIVEPVGLGRVGSKVVLLKRAQHKPKVGVVLNRAPALSLDMENEGNVCVLSMSLQVVRERARNQSLVVPRRPSESVDSVVYTEKDAPS